jgi:hypothetical protein
MVCQVHAPTKHSNAHPTSTASTYLPAVACGSCSKNQELSIEFAMEPTIVVPLSVMGDEVCMGISACGGVFPSLP